ncbi:MAG: DUF5801 repeats-in-toxin domain-containing protein [Methylovirgula sp.]
MSANVVTLTATITDGLGHRASASLDHGKQIIAHGRWPRHCRRCRHGSGADAQRSRSYQWHQRHQWLVIHSTLTTVTGHFAGDFTDASGADGLKSTTYALSIQGGNGTASGLVDSQTGQADVLIQNGKHDRGPCRERQWRAGLQHYARSGDGRCHLH